MNINKTKIIVICGILVLSVFAGLLIKISLREQPIKFEQTSVTEKSEKMNTLKKAELGFSPTVKLLEEINVPTLPISRQPNAVTPFFENINKVVEKVEESLVPNNPTIQKISTKTSTGIILSLTDRQFHFLYPDYFIASLIDVQNSFIKEYDPNYETISKIETDAQVRFIEEKIVATFLSADMITRERAQQFITTIRFTLPQLQLIDLKQYYSFGLYEFLPRTAPKRLFLAGFMEELANALAHKAQAKVCGACFSLPECFQLGASTPAVPGKELFLPSCYCTGCLIPLGCLSLCTGQAAIYDQLTGICGCGL